MVRHGLRRGLRKRTIADRPTQDGSHGAQPAKNPFTISLHFVTPSMERGKHGRERETENPTSDSGSLRCAAASCVNLTIDGQSTWLGAAAPPAGRPRRCTCCRNATCRRNHRLVSRKEIDICSEPEAHVRSYARNRHGRTWLHRRVRQPGYNAQHCLLTIEHRNAGAVETRRSSPHAHHVDSYRTGSPSTYLIATQCRGRSQIATTRAYRYH